MEMSSFPYVIGNQLLRTGRLKAIACNALAFSFDRNLTSFNFGVDRHTSKMRQHQKTAPQKTCIVVVVVFSASSLFRKKQRIIQSNSIHLKRAIVTPQVTWCLHFGYLHFVCLIVFSVAFCVCV